MAERRWPEQLDSVVEEFEDCFDSMERYELLFEYAKNHPSPLPDDEWTEENQVHGCQSRAHVECDRDDSGNFLMRGGGRCTDCSGINVRNRYGGKWNESKGSGTNVSRLRRCNGDSEFFNSK